MKNIWIMRHAKSDWSHPDLTDFDRPINKRGRYDAPLMGQWMGTLSHRPDLIVSSPARRAKQTAELVAKALPFSEELRFWEDLYPGSAATTIAAIRELSEELQSILIIGHNPNMEDAGRGLRDGLINQGEYDKIFYAIRKARQPPWNTKLGGEIMIHGARRGGRDTEGYIALEDKDIRELYQRISIGTKVTITP